MALPPIPVHSQPFTVAGSATPDQRWYEWLSGLAAYIRALPESGAGVGDMLKATYDTNNNGVVDAAASVPWTGVTGVPATFPPSAHTHDDRYYTETEADALLATKANEAITLTAGAGLTGGGDLSANRSFAVGAGTGITVNADDVALDTTSTRNVDHASVTLTAGNGLTGGGDITTNRSFAVGAGTGIQVNADDVAVIYGTTAGTAAQGNDSRITGAFQTSSAAALTRTNDTNVTVTLGGSPSTALVNAASLTLGWTGTLAVSRGGTGADSASGTALDNITGFSSTGVLARTASGTYAFRTIAAGTGISVSNGNGVSGNPTIALADTAVTPATYGTEDSVPRITVDQQGRITGVTSVTTDGLKTISSAGSVDMAQCSGVLFDLASPGNITGWTNVVPGKTYVLRSTNGNATITTAGAYLIGGTNLTIASSGSALFTGHTTTVLRQLTAVTVAT